MDNVSGGRLFRLLMGMALSCFPLQLHQHIMTPETGAVFASPWDVLDPMALRSPTEERVPDSPQNVGSKAASRSVTLWWEPPRSAEEVLVRGYTVSYGEEEESSSRRVVLEGVNTNAFTVDDLKPNTTYVFALTAYNEAEGEDSEEVLMTVSTLPDESKSLDRNFGLLAPSSLESKLLSGLPMELLVSWKDQNKLSEEFPETGTATGTSEAVPNHLRPYYILEYNPAEGRQHHPPPQRLTTESTSTILTNLLANVRYEIVVRLVLPDGRQMATTSPPNLMEEFCDFESPALCDFINDPAASIDWRREEQLTGHAMVLDYFSTKNSHHHDFGRLLSPIYGGLNAGGGDDEVENWNYFVCISFRYAIRPGSYGGFFKVKMLTEDEDVEESARLVYSKPVEKAGTTRDWKNVTLQIKRRNPKRGYQVLFEGARNANAIKSNFLIHLDDVVILSGRCPEDSLLVESLADAELIAAAALKRCCASHECISSDRFYIGRM